MYLHVSERWIESIFQYTIRLSLSCWSLKTGLSWCWTQYLASLSTECSPYRQDQTQTSQFGQACPGLAHRDRLDKIGASLSRQIGLVQSLSVRIRQDQSWNLPPMQTAHLIEPATLLVGWCPTIRLLADPAGSLAGLLSCRLENGWVFKLPIQGSLIRVHLAVLQSNPGPSLFWTALFERELNNSLEHCLSCRGKVANLY